MEKGDAKESGAINLKVQAAQITQLYKQTWTGLTGTIAVALAVCIILWQVIPRWELLLWTGALVVVSAGRGLLAFNFQRRSPSISDIHSWGILHVVGTVASGVL